MFERILPAEYSATVKAAYEASLRLYERERFKHPEARAALLRPYGRTFNAPAQESLPPEVADAISGILARIEEREGKPFFELSDESAGEYITELDRIVTERGRARPGYDPERGRELLEELRRDYGRAA